MGALETLAGLLQHVEVEFHQVGWGETATYAGMLWEQGDQVVIINNAPTLEELIEKLYQEYSPIANYG